MDIIAYGIVSSGDGVNIRLEDWAVQTFGKALESDPVKYPRGVVVIGNNLIPGVAEGKMASRPVSVFRDSNCKVPDVLVIQHRDFDVNVPRSLDIVLSVTAILHSTGIREIFSFDRSLTAVFISRRPDDSEELDGDIALTTAIGSQYSKVFPGLDLGIIR